MPHGRVLTPGSQASLDRGYGRCQVLRKNATLIRKYPNGTWVNNTFIESFLLC